MNPTLRLVAILFLLSSVASFCAETSSSRVIAPPDSFFQKVRERDREAARQFYKKYLEVNGLPVAASGEVADQALERTSYIVTHMLAGRPDILQAMVSNGMYLIVIGKDQLYTDMPEHSHSPNPAYQNERVRGTGGKPTSFGEENVLCLPFDRYDHESIGVHEFCHTIDGTLRSIDPGWSARLNITFRHATDRGLWKNTYASSNPGEFWGEVCQAYFDCGRANNWNHGPIARREQLKVYDPETYELVRTIFNLSPEQDWRYSWLQKLPMVSPPPTQCKIDPYYTKFTWADEFPVIGRSASDEALLKANETINKMFSYRHDILKALIADGVKLAVLGRNESLMNLPECASLKEWKEFDPTARLLEYTLGKNKLLVVAEENVVGDPHEPLVGDCLVIRQMAKALYHVTGTRAEDPNWDKRGRAVQQYELRLKRIDVRFDQKLDELFNSARKNGLWKGTTAVYNKVEYWVAGVLAYFDAAGQTSAPLNASHPIRTRELLKEYDPALFALVNETMAYEGHVDWRYPGVKEIFNEPRRLVQQRAPSDSAMRSK
jgi:alpha-glucosidase